MAENKYIALGALAVAIVVPLATLWVTTRHDDRRLHAEQLQADRAELRQVLDKAADALNAMSRSFARANSQGRVPDGIPFQEELVAIDRRSSSVAIRLGRNSPAARQMRRAGDAAGAITEAVLTLRIAQHEHRDEPNPPDPLRLLRRFFRESDRFIDEANRVARSTTG